MAELTIKEKQVFTEYCDILSSNLYSHKEICTKYNIQEYSFEYLFLFNRVKIAASTSHKAMIKAIKEIKIELKISSKDPYYYAPPEIFQEPQDEQLMLEVPF